MRTAIYSSVYGVCLVLASDCWAQAAAPDELSRALVLVRSSSAIVRVHGFEQLDKLWYSQDQALLRGFSDTPVENKPKVEKRPALSDESVDRIAKAIERGLGDEDPSVRKSAASAICSAPRARPAVISAITVGVNSKDATVTWYVCQQAARTPPPIEAVIQSLIAKLGSDEFNYWAPSHVLQAYGSKADPYADQIVDTVLRSKKDRYGKMYVLFDISLKDAATKKLAGAAKEFTRDELGVVAVLLLDHPDLLKQIESERPETISALQEQMSRLSSFLYKNQSADNEIRKWLSSSDELLPTTMALLGEKRFIPKIAAAEASASNHKKPFLAACKRACGAEPGKQILVDADHPVTFRPKSAWPKMDDRRRSKTALGHGDGHTYVMLTGEVRAADGAHPKSIKFFRVNDGMLLGSKQNRPEDILYDSTTGRFVFYTTVFAAYCSGKDRPEPGPYQTGSAQIRVEADGFEPLTLKFFDEMPDVVITLSRQSEN